MPLPAVWKKADIEPARVSPPPGTGAVLQSFALPLTGRAALLLLLMGMLLLAGCEDLAVHDTASLLLPRFQRSEVFGFVAGFGTTFAAAPDLVRMLRRRSSKGINPTMAGIMAIFQVLWVYYGLLIASRPVIAWNLVAVIINSITVLAYFRFARREAAEGER